jgi:lysophospholipase L1-like esterase
MKRNAGPMLCLTLVFLFAGLAALADDPVPESGLKREAIEWCDVWFTHADKADKPRVLLIGDSIVQGYFPLVEKELGDAVYWGRFTTSRSICDPVFFQELALVIKQYRFSVIHFNHGLHGWGYTEAQYAEAFDKLLKVLKEDGQGAKLLWATTTPVQSGSSMGSDQPRVAERNKIAAEKVTQAGIAIDDLYALSIDKPEYYSKDGVHFSQEGKEVQGKTVAVSIRKALQSLSEKDVNAVSK